MSSTGFPGQQPQLQKSLKQELQNEITAAGQSLWEIHAIIQQLKEFVQPGGELDATITQTVNVLEKTGNMSGLN